MTELGRVIEQLEEEIEKLDCPTICSEHKEPISHILAGLFLCEKCSWSKFPAAENLFSNERTTAIRRVESNIKEHAEFLKTSIEEFTKKVEDSVKKFQV